MLYLSGHPCLSCIRCSTKKIKCNPASLGSQPKCTRGKSTTGRMRSKTPAPAPSNAPSPSQSRARTRSQSRGPSRTPAIPAATTPQVQSCGCSKTITAKKPDLHFMAIVIRDGAAHITILEACVHEQDDKIDTLQHLHESLRCKVVDQHPSFPLSDTPADATILLDQSIPPRPFMEPTPLTVEDGSAMVGLMVEPTQVQPEGPQSSGEIVVPDEPGNLLPEYNSSDEEMDVEVKVKRPGEEVEMAT
ncbi:hypothetical protein EV424DRAFT_1542696 [Suillus variegatus]|nr:hypothetical protein EV424DRAFT_1542696 [Suillus variegatus]